jgi:hypothetical protein
MPAPAAAQRRQTHTDGKSMAQNLISLAFTDADLTAIDAALTTLEEKLAALISLQPSEVRALAKMGDKSEAFCRQTLTILEQNPQVVPASLNLPETLNDLRAIDQLRPRMARLERLSKRADDTFIALGSDIVTAALEGYALLRVSGKGQGLETLRLGCRLASPRRGAKRNLTRPERRTPAQTEPRLARGFFVAGMRSCLLTVQRLHRPASNPSPCAMPDFRSSMTDFSSAMSDRMLSVIEIQWPMTERHSPMSEFHSCVTEFRSRVRDLILDRD